MAGDIIIRKAKKEYVCMCCNHIIKVGEQYLDRIIFAYGKPVRHDRYHDECPASTDVERLMEKIEAEEGNLIATDNEGDKWHIVGVQYVDCVPMVVIEDWVDEHTNVVSFDIIKTFLDANGDNIL